MMSFNLTKRKKKKYTYDLIIRENIKEEGLENETRVNVIKYHNNEAQSIEKTIANLFDKLSREGFIDRSLYHLAKFDAKDREDNEAVNATIDKMVNYLMNLKNLKKAKNAGRSPAQH